MNNAMPFRIIAAFTLVFATLVPHASGEDEDGLFADFETSLGDFTARLEFEKVPRTVANFVGLAEGSRPWVHSQTGAVHENDPFYTGIIFHRVIEGFMSQTGSRKGDGTDGPGYTFRDEFDPTLRHDGPYVLSMANSGPNSNGSQFFITAANTSHLDDLHSVFGLVTSGQAVVDAINQVATTNNDRPLQDVVIQSVTIRRVGAAAEAFDVHVWDLPEIRAAHEELLVIPQASVESQVELFPGEIISVWGSTDVAAWEFIGQLYRPVNTEPISGVSFDNAAVPRAFYHIPVVRYQDPMGPASLANLDFEFTLADGSVIAHTMAADGVSGSTVIQPPGEEEPLAGGYEVLFGGQPPQPQFQIRVNSIEVILFDNSLQGTPYFAFWFTMGLDHRDGDTVSGRLRVQFFNSDIDSWVPQPEGTFTMQLPPPPAP